MITQKINVIKVNIGYFVECLLIIYDSLLYIYVSS